MARSQTSVERRTKPELPWRYGYRYTKDGIVPLTEDDLLHPQEGDFVVQNDYHDSDRHYLKGVFNHRSPRRRRIRALADHRIDFQQDGLQPLGPDVTVLEGVPPGWDRSKGTFRVVDMNAHVLCAIEITSPETRRVDLNKKIELYYRAGVPLYIIIDAPYGGSKKPRGVVAHRAGPNGYELQSVDDKGRFWLADFNMSIGLQDGHVVCFDENGAPIRDWEETEEKLEQETARADEEKARADEEKARADEEKARADSLAARLRELEASAKKPTRRKK